MPLRGRAGAELTLEQAQEAARTCAINLLAVVRSELGSLDAVHMGRLGAGAVGKTARTTPIRNVGCQTGHLAGRNAAKVSQTTPITEDGCQMCHFRPGSAANASQTTPIRCTGRYSVRLHQGIPEAESPSTLAAGGPGWGSSVWRSTEHYEASWGAQSTIPHSNPKHNETGAG